MASAWLPRTTPPPAYATARRHDPLLRPPPDAPLGLVATTKQVAHIADITKIPSYIEGNPFVVVGVELGGYRTVLAVPMLKDNELVGAITFARQEVRLFTDQQIELVKNFVAQAVIAIENTRLLNELRQRTTDLTESLEQQTATTEVLGVISSSPGDIQPVFAAMLENAVRICDAKFGVVYRCEGDVMRSVAMHNVPPALAALGRDAPFRPSPKHYFGPLMVTKTVVHVADLAAEQGYIDRRPEYVASVEAGGVRTYVVVPMLKGNELIGVFLMGRQDVRPFTDKQIALAQNFAAQAVIAIENTRLLNDLRESLEQQTATSEVLRVISSSPGELKLVFQTMLDNAVRICEAKFGILFLYDGDSFDAAALVGVPQAYAEFLQSGPHRFGDTPSSRAARTRQVVYVEDLRLMIKADNAPVRKAIELGGVRTAVCVPMLKENESIGVLTIYRQEVRPFSDKQIELLSNFAKQAVIAIENTRLLNELRESLQQQTATSEVLGIISSSPGELKPRNHAGKCHAYL